MIDMSAKEIEQGLSKVQTICKQVVNKIEQERGRISGFKPELAKIHTHLETYRSLSRTRGMTGKLKTTRDLGSRSKRTRGYVDLAIDTFSKLSQDTSRVDVVLWRFGWLDRLLRVESGGGGGRNQRKNYQPVRGPRRGH